MPIAKKQADFLASDQGVDARQKLTMMMSDKTYETSPSYSSNANLYPGNRITFVDKHMNYLMNHQDTDPAKYLANLRLMTRIR